MKIQKLKSQAKILATSLKDKKITLSHSQSLDIIAQIHGYKDWNTASALQDKNEIYPIEPEIMNGMMHYFFGLDDSPIEFNQFQYQHSKNPGISLTIKNMDIAANFGCKKIHISGSTSDGKKLVNPLLEEKSWLHLLGLQLASVILKISQTYALLNNSVKKKTSRPYGLTQVNLLLAELQNKECRNFAEKVKINLIQKNKQYRELEIIEDFVKQLPKIYNPIVYADLIHELLDENYSMECTKHLIYIFYGKDKIAEISAGKLMPNQ